MKKICLSLALALVAAVAVRAADTSSLDAGVMKVALHAATPGEEKFIDNVLTLVEKDVLPIDLVQSTFLWAKKKSNHKFQYFKRGLILRAKEQGITI
jgi:hypothetical protein